MPAPPDTDSLCLSATAACLPSPKPAQTAPIMLHGTPLHIIFNQRDSGTTIFYLDGYYSEKQHISADYMQLLQLLLAFSLIKVKCVDSPYQQCFLSTTSGLASSPLFTTGLQSTPYCAAPTGPLYHQEQGMIRIPSAAREAQEKRMARKRKMALHKHSRELGQISTTVQLGSVQQERSYTGNWAFWSSLAANSWNGVGFMVPSQLSDGSSSSSQMMQTIHGGQHVSSVLWPRNSATLKWQDLRSQDGYLKFVLQKVLRRSDVGSLGRIVLPKKEAEIHLPELGSKDGIMIPMEEISTSRIWKMRYRFWPNNNSRMYVLENTGTFILSNGLKEGDCIQIYSDLKSGKYMIRGMKARRLQDKRGKFVGQHGYS